MVKLVEIKTAESAGFCFGVERAVNRVYEEIKGEAAVYTYGPIIHNDEVVRSLKEQGVTVINDVEHILRGYENIIQKLTNVGASIYLEEK